MTYALRSNLPKSGILVSIVFSLLLHALAVAVFPLTKLARESAISQTTLPIPDRVRWLTPPQAVPQTSMPEGPVVDVLDDKNVTTKAPPDARFLSDKNRTVEKETQSKITGPNPTASVGSLGRSEASGKPGPMRGAKVGQKGGNDLRLSPSFIDELPKAKPGSSGEQGQPGLPGSVAAVAPSNYLPEIAFGNETLLNTRQYAYATFFIRMKRQMEGVWNPRPYMDRLSQKQDQYTTVVEIVLRRDGYLEEVHVARSSGSDSLDREALAAVRNAAPYLNPPLELIDEDGHIRIPQWHFIVTMRAVF